MSEPECPPLPCCPSGGDQRRAEAVCIAEGQSSMVTAKCTADRAGQFAAVCDELIKPTWERGACMTELTRQKIFQLAARRLRQEFEELGIIPHSGAKGGEAERLMRRFSMTT